MKPNLRELQKDVMELKEKHNLEKQSNAITKNDMYHFQCFLDDQNPRIVELLKELGGHLARNNISGLVGGTIEPDPENLLHKKYIDLSDEIDKLKMIELKKWIAPLTDEEAYNRIKTRNY